MAYAGTTLYLGAATAVIFTGSDILGSGNRRPLILVTLVAGVLIAVSFVIWQLAKRRLAGDIVSACTSLLSQHLAGELDNPDMTRRRYQDLEFPAFISNQIIAVADSRKLSRAAGPSEAATYIAMGVWTLLAALRVCA
jgi:hypothetical protein